MYDPRPAPTDLNVEAVWRELEEIRTALRTMKVDYVEYKIHHVEPSKPKEGRVYYADGTNWNPGAGAGLYVRLAASWSKL